MKETQKFQSLLKCLSIIWFSNIQMPNPDQRFLKCACAKFIWRLTLQRLLWFTRQNANPSIKWNSNWPNLKEVDLNLKSFVFIWIPWGSSTYSKIVWRAIYYAWNMQGSRSCAQLKSFKNTIYSAKSSLLFFENGINLCFLYSKQLIQTNKYWYKENKFLSILKSQER